MHDINYTHEHELDEHDFLDCCKDCLSSVDIIKPHIMAFAARIKRYTRESLAALSPEDLYRLYQILDDLAHMEAGLHLAGLILKDPDIRMELPVIRSYYSTFFSIHEVHLADELLKSDAPWETLRAFPLYPRYEALVKNQIEAMHIAPDSRLAFIGGGPVPSSLILMSRLYGIRSVGLDKSYETVELSTQVIKCLGLEKEIGIIHGDESCLKDLDWNMVLVAALAEPKARIFQSLRELLKKRGHASVVFRTYTGMRAILYEPVKPDDIEGFKIVKEILPIGRVNNTTVFAELDE
ncbi:MAG: nicotianamine synthase [Desulfobacterales bacterium S5133MH4]|nr:MAG: nicotianamine synthase [Desulfobacterales bacterium S5133MH4]